MVYPYQMRIFKGILVAALAVGIFFGGYFFGSTEKSGPRSSSSLNLSLVNEVYSLIRGKFIGTIDSNKLSEGAAAGLVSGLNDPYSEYLSIDESNALKDELSGEVTGIGVEVGKKDTHIVIIAPIEKSPAAAAGLRAGDIILSVDEKPVYATSLLDAVSRIRGTAGTKVKLKIQRGSAVFDVELTRQVVSVPSVAYKELEPRIGYIKISVFASDVSREIKKAADTINARGIKTVIIDLRGNPGGLYDEAVSFLDEIFDSGTLVIQEMSDGKRIESKAKPGGAMNDKKFVVLFDEGSASAAEIVAGALIDLKDVLTVGQKTFGKGSVQQPFDLANGGQLKLTVAKWLTPRGRLIDGNGIEPKIVIEGADAQLSRALEIAKNL